MKINELHRDDKIANFVNKLEESISCLLFYGNSGVGKTTFLKQVNDSLNSSGYNSLYISFHKPEKEILQELLEFAKRILKIESITIKIIKDLKKNKHQYIRNLTVTLIKDIVNLVPISNVIKESDTYKELTAIMTKTTSELSAMQQQIDTLAYDLFPALLSAIQEYSNYFDKKNIYNLRPSRKQPDEISKTN
jgi:Cdc6-like AAA superfamily ATPase